MTVAILAPTFNNARTLPDVMLRAAMLGHHIMVVNDGSTDATASWLDRWASEMGDGATVLTHDRNRGKAHALQTGFARAAQAGFTHAVTLDTDGQLDPEDIPTLLGVAAEHPEALIIGTRDDSLPDYPTGSRIGRRLSNLAIRLETGVRVADCQCGLRVYPLRIFDVVQCRTRRYAFEAEVITRAAWAGCYIFNVPVTCRYLQGNERVSHFRPWLDSCHGVMLHAMLLVRSLVPLPHRRLSPRSANVLSPCRTQFWRGLLAWFSPVALWRQLRHDQAARTSQAVGVGLGVLIANLPIYGLQTITSLYVAGRLHIHPLSVVAGSQVSTPPMNIVLALAAIKVGHFVIRGSEPAPAGSADAQLALGDLAGALMIEWLVGGVILGIVLGLASFAICSCVFSLLAVDDNQEVSLQLG